MSEQTTTEPSDLVTVTIEGQELQVAKGTAIIEAAKTIGHDIASFCYHPGLSIAACCRQCLVEVEGMPKLQPSCQLGANEGMVVKVNSDEALQARRQLLEFTLLNHPIDCPICDKAGECTLQRHYFDHDNLDSRLDHKKVKKKKVVDLGPTIVLDQERCILCTRCIRVCDEVAGVHQLEMANRGDHEELGTAPGAVLDNPYSLNTVDVCPVGALTSKDFRFKMRAWELTATPSVCNGCATGCNIEIHHNNGKVARLVPRENLAVNQYWMCDDGRFTYKALSEQRLASPRIGAGSASWDKALDHAAQALRSAAKSDKTKVGLVLSAAHTNEANWALLKLGEKLGEGVKIYVAANPDDPERADDILRDADRNANTKGVRALLGDDAAAELGDLQGHLKGGDLDALVVLGDVSFSPELVAAAGKLSCLVVFSSVADALVDQATAAFPCAAWAELDGTITNRNGSVQRMHPAFAAPGTALPAWKALTRLASSADAVLSFDSAKAAFGDAAKAAGWDAALWGKAQRSIQLRFANSRG